MDVLTLELRRQSTGLNRGCRFRGVVRSGDGKAWEAIVVMNDRRRVVGRFEEEVRAKRALNV